MANAQEYAAAVAKLIANAKSLSPEAVAAIDKLLTEASRRILARLAETDPQSYTATQLQSILGDIDATMLKFRTDATAKVNALQQRAAIMATHDMSAAVGAGLGTATSYGQLNPNTLRIAQGYTADLITGLSADAAAKLKGAVQRAFLGGQTLQQVIEQVGHALEGGKFSGVFTDTGDRAMRVAVNEILRVHSIASQARLQDLASRNKAIKKQWLHVPAAKVPRLTHILADGQVREVDEPFLVAGEELMYPRDPKGRPDNTIYCHCVQVPYIDDDDLYANDDDRAVLEKAGLKIETASDD